MEQTTGDPDKIRKNTKNFIIDETNTTWDEGDIANYKSGEFDLQERKQQVCVD